MGHYHVILDAPGYIPEGAIKFVSATGPLCFLSWEGAEHYVNELIDKIVDGEEDCRIAGSVREGYRISCRSGVLVVIEIHEESGPTCPEAMED